jgi:two-component system, NtrC family, response regulator AtoC
MTTMDIEKIAPMENRDFVAWISPAMQTLESVAAEIAPTDIPVLLVGESGSGKEVLARQIHRLSNHANEPLIKIPCASMTPEAFSVELGLNRDGNRSRSLSAAGTVLFDEVSELDATSQPTLLYALPDGDARPHSKLLAARVISTTSRNLVEEMRAGSFRSELYYRINGVCLRLPPLRDHKEDIPLLAEFFLTRHAAQFGRPRPSLSSRTLQMFQDHPWPGNIRELENFVKEIVALGDEQLAVADLEIAARDSRMADATEMRGHSLKAAARAASRGAEREMILKALARTRWNRKLAAQELQISYKSLLYKLKQIELKDSEISS